MNPKGFILGVPSKLLYAQKTRADISYFNREIKHDDFLKKYNVNISDIRNIGNELNTLFIFRDNYDYRDAVVDEEAEKIWLNLYPKLENIVILILNSMKE